MLVPALHSCGCTNRTQPVYNIVTHKFYPLLNSMHTNIDRESPTLSRQQRVFRNKDSNETEDMKKNLFNIYSFHLLNKQFWFPRPNFFLYLSTKCCRNSHSYLSIWVIWCAVLFRFFSNSICARVRNLKFEFSALIFATFVHILY